MRHVFSKAIQREKANCSNCWDFLTLKIWVFLQLVANTTGQLGFPFPQSAGLRNSSRPLPNMWQQDGPHVPALMSDLELSFDLEISGEADAADRAFLCRLK